MKCTIVENSIKLEKPFSYFLGTLDALEYSKITITDGDVSGVGEGFDGAV